MSTRLFETQVTGLDELPAAAMALAQHLPEHGAVLFYGEMGAGKTTLIKALCKALDVVDEVSSPTYALVNEYKTRSGRTVYHFDLYRLNEPEEALDIGFEEYLADDALSLIEWPERLGPYRPDAAFRVDVEDLLEYRQLTLSK